MLILHHVSFHTILIQEPWLALVPHPLIVQRYGSCRDNKSKGRIP